MTYTLNNGTSMVLADVGDTFEVDPMLIFTMDGKEVPVAAVIPSIQSIDIQEDPIMDGFNLELTDAAGQVSNHFFPTLDGIATHLQRMATAAPQEPAEDAPAAEAVDDPSPATGAAQAAVDGAMGLLKEDVNGLLDDDSQLRIAFHIAQRVFSADTPQITLADVDKVAELLTASDRLAADAESTGKSIRSGKTKSAAEAAAAEARAAANIMARFLFADEDLELADFYNSNFTAWCSLGPWLRLYQQMLLLRRSVEGGNLGTLTMTRNQDTGKPILQHPDGKVFTVGDIPDYTVYVFDSCDTTISVALSSGYRIRLDDRYATDDELRDRLLFGVSAAVGDYNYGLMYYLNDFEDDWAPSTCDDVITVAANASPSDLLALFLVYSFGHWRNDPHSEYEIEDVVRDMAGRLRGAPAAPVWAAQEAAEAAPGQEVTDDTTPATEPATEPSDGQQVDACDAVSTSTMKRVLSAAKRLIARCDKCVKLQADGFHDAANVEMGDIITLGSSLQLEMVGFVGLDTWDAVNTSAASATHGRGDPRYWGYIAGEYVKLAEQRLAA